MSAELFTLGEGLMRLAVAPGDRLEDAATMRATVGGAEANVALAVARMGHSATWFSRLPATSLGRRVAAELVRHGVDVSTVIWVPEGKLGIHYLEPAVATRPGQVLYDRAGSSVAAMTVDNVPWELVDTARVVHLTGITPALSPSLAEVTLETARRAQAAGAFVTVDVNYRARLWVTEAARPVLTRLCACVDLVVVAEDDACRLLGVVEPPERATTRLQQLLDVEAGVLTRGRAGCVWRIGNRTGAVPAVPAEPLDPVGAGDAFTAGIVVGVIEGDLERALSLGSAMAALKLGWVGDQFWGDRALVERVLVGEVCDLDR